MNELHERAPAAASLSSCALDTSFFFSSPTGLRASEDAGTPLRCASSADVASEVARALAFRARQGRSEACVAGAIAFEAGRAPRLRLYDRLQTAADLPSARARESTVCVTSAPSRVAMQPTPAGYMDAVARAVARIQRGALRKVVLARTLDLELAQPLDLPMLLERLAQQNPGKYVFRCDLGEPSDRGRVLLGASPELLVGKRGLEVTSHPLAGSLPRSSDRGEDEARAARLTCSPKNLREHAVVVEAVSDTLAPYCRQLSVPSRPALVQTATMWHLGTRIGGQLRDPETSSLALALALHPTPAVCGEPAPQASAAIAELEGFDRAYFAGTVGHCDARGDGEWAVTIRCAEASERALRLYAGAGIVADSTPEDELAETAAKLRTMLCALGFEQLLEVL